MSDHERARERMVKVQIAGRGVRDRGVLEAMRLVPRELFVDRGYEEFAYEDSPLPIGEGQTISQPYIVALMIEAAELKRTDRVLEVGAGSGYAAAVMSRIATGVYAIERHAALGETARRRIEKLGYDNVELRIDDGTRGWPEAAPFDAILVAASGPDVPRALKEQLAAGGRLISTAMAIGASYCSAKPLTAHRSSIEHAQPLRGASSSSTDLPLWRWKRTGPTRLPWIALFVTVLPAVPPSRRSSGSRRGCGAIPMSRSSWPGCTRAIKASLRNMAPDSTGLIYTT